MRKATTRLGKRTNRKKRVRNRNHAQHAEWLRRKVQRWIRSLKNAEGVLTLPKRLARALGCRVVTVEAACLHRYPDNNCLLRL